MTQPKLAELSGVNQTEISRIDGGGNPAHATLEGYSPGIRPGRSAGCFVNQFTN